MGERRLWWAADEGKAIDQTPAATGAETRARPRGREASGARGPRQQANVICRGQRAPLIPRRGSRPRETRQASGASRGAGQSRRWAGSKGPGPGNACGSARVASYLTRRGPWPGARPTTPRCASWHGSVGGDEREEEGGEEGEEEKRRMPSADLMPADGQSTDPCRPRQERCASACHGRALSLSASVGRSVGLDARCGAVLADTDKAKPQVRGPT